MAEEKLILTFGETGAEVVGAKIRATTKSIRDMENAMKSAFSGGGKFGGSGSLFDPHTFQKFGDAADKAKDKVGALARGLTYMGAAITGIAIRKFVSEIVHMVDSLTNLQNKIRVVTDSTEQMLGIQQRLFDMSRETRTGIDAIATVYTRTARSVKDLGKTQNETLKFTETLSKAVAVGGSTAVEASNAMVQLSQGLSSGTLRGDELRSVLEQLPVVARLIADSMGVSVGQLRALGAAGKLTSEQVFDAVVRGSDKINASFAKMTPTVAQAWEVMKSKAIEASSALQPMVESLSKGMLNLADNFDDLIRSGTAAVQVIGVLLAAKAIPTAINAFNGLTAAMARNPFGLLAVGISAAVAALLPFADKIGDTKDSVVTLRDVWEAFKNKMVQDLGVIGEAFKKAFDFVSFQAGIENILRNTAAAADALHGLANPDKVIRAHLGDKGAEDDLTANRRGMAAFLSRSKGEAADRIARGMQKTEEEFNIFMASRMPEAPGVKRPGAPPKPPGGTSFEDILRELQDGLRVEQSGKLQIREGGGQVTLPSQRSAQDLFTASPEDQAIAKILEASIDKLGKKQPRMTAGQIGQLEDVIRQQQGLISAKKEQEEVEKEITKRLDEQLKLQIQLIEAERKQELDDSFKASLHDVDIQNSLDPNFGTKQRIKDLEEFRDTPGRVQSAAAQAQMEITRLTESMNPLQVAFQGVADTMVQGFGDAIARAIVLNENIGSLMQNLIKMMAMQAISGLISTGISGGMNALGLAGATASVANTPGSPDRGLIGGRVPGFATGGYTGSTGGITHPNEYVLNAQATRNIGVANLNAMNGGGSAMPKIVINNNNGSQVSVDESAMSRGEIVVLIESTIAKKAPDAVAGALSQRNSSVSKSLRGNYDVSARNV
jgi:tape measure domain-containing protein